MTASEEKEAPAGRGLRLEAAAQGAARAGGRLPVRVTLVNEAEAPVRVNGRLALGYRDLPVRELFAEVVHADSGRPAEFDRVDYDRGASPPSDYRELAPGESVSGEVDLFEMYPLTAPGRYRVTLFYDAHGPLADAPDDVARGVVASEPVEIEVGEGSA